MSRTRQQQQVLRLSQMNVIREPVTDCKKCLNGGWLSEDTDGELRCLYCGWNADAHMEAAK
jgi:hypothetical protein